jgi:hypothetical protein
MPHVHSVTHCVRLSAERTPSAASVIQKVYNEGYGPHEVHHDHLAFRSFGVSHTGCAMHGAVVSTMLTRRACTADMLSGCALFKSGQKSHHGLPITPFP